MTTRPAPLRCAGCGATSTPENEKHWREVKVEVRAVPPRVAKAKKTDEVLCPLCAGEAVDAMEGKSRDEDACN